MNEFHRNLRKPTGLIFYAIFTFAGMACAGTYSGGIGTAEDPYKISSVADWQELIAASADWDKSFILTADLDMRGVSVNPVASNFKNVNGTMRGDPFTGILDGNGHCIRNFVINRPDTFAVGLFGYLGNGGEIRNLSLRDATIKGEEIVGGLVALNGYWYDTDGGTITSCSVSGIVTGSTTGGLVGCNYKGAILRCVATASITATDVPGELVGYVTGGLVGENYYGSIASCYSVGFVTGVRNCGGLVGYNDNGSIIACYAMVDVKGDNAIGGFVGYNARATIVSCYSTGKVTCTGMDAGGFVGCEYEGLITACFWDKESSGWSGNSKGGKGLSSLQMNTMQIFQNAGWGGYGWIMEDGQSCPRLPWENAAGLPIPAAKAMPLNGDGTETDPYQIWTAEEFAMISWYYPSHNQCFILMSDLDLAGQYLDPIGDLGPFEGTFDGQDHILVNAVIERPTSDYIGIFASIGSEGHIRNIHIENIRLSGSQYVGGLAGMNSGEIISCSAEGSVVGKEIYIGGLVGGNIGGTIQTSYANITIPSGDNRRINDSCGGLVGTNDNGCILSCWTTGSVTGRYSIAGIAGLNRSGSIQDCFTTCTILGSFQVGGLVGFNYGSITNCTASGKVRGTNEEAGGLVGSNGEAGTISFCYATVVVEGEDDTGGLVGYNHGLITSCYATGSVSGNYGVGGLVGMNSSMITICYATGEVNGTGSVGGLVGFQYWGSAVQCYSIGKVTGDDDFGGLIGHWGSPVDSFWDIQTSGLTISAGGTGKTTQQMKTLSTFTKARWDLKGNDGDPADWFMPMNDYPKLAWQDSEAALIPNLSRMTEAEAAAALASKGLTVGAVTMTTDFSVPAGRIISQSPEAGLLVGKGYAVSYGVSLGTNIQGQGTAANPYRIWTVADFLTFSIPSYAKKYWAVGVHIRLMNDLDLINLELNPIGTDPAHPFEGSFDGHGHALENPWMELPGGDFVGLFGVVGMHGSVRSLRVKNLSMNGRYYVGGLVGYNQGSIFDCHVNGWILSSRNSIGGLAGINDHGTIEQSSAGGYVLGADSVGGLVGDNNQGLIARCQSAVSTDGMVIVGGLAGKNDGTITACFSSQSVWARALVGGLVGDHSYGLVESCYATGPVYGEVMAGGLVGNNLRGVIGRSFSAGSVAGSDAIGGLVGNSFSGVCQDCFWDVQSSGQALSAGGVGKTTVEMKTWATFTDAGWDFVGESANGTADVWRMCADEIDYPRLSWEFSQGGDMDCPDGVALEDLVYLAGRWLGNTPTTVGAADVNGDGKANLEDFAAMAENWNKSL